MSPSRVLACLVLAAALVLPFEPWSAHWRSPWALEVTVSSDQSGLVQLYYDTGSGMSEDMSALVPIGAGAPSRLRFPLPYGTVRALRYDPIDRQATQTISQARIVDGSGATVLMLAGSDFIPQNQIASARPSGDTVVVETEHGGTDPQFRLNLSKPLEIARPPLWRVFALVFAGCLAAAAALSWAFRKGPLGLAQRWGALGRRAAARPALAVLAVAFAATALANYPVVFAGRSVLSPHLGAAMLYGQNPWLPGLDNAEVGTANKADIAALLWQHLPLSVIEHRAVARDLDLPLWNRYDSCGVPLLGQGQSCFGDPLHMLVVAAGGAGWAWELKFLAAKALFALAIGLCVLWTARSLPAALLVTASAPFIGHFIYRINHPAVFSVCYAPWILVCWLGLLRGRGARAAVLWLLGLVGACWSEMNSGTGKEAYTLLILMNVSGALLVLFAREAPGRKAALLAGAVASGAVFTGLSCPIWLTFARALKASYTSYNTPMAFQLQPGMALGLFDEAFFRPFQESLGTINPSANAFALVGVLWVLVGWRALRADRAVLALLVAAAPLLALVFGAVPPSLVMRVPFLANIQHIDNTLSCSLIVLLLVLSGIGWRHAIERLRGPEGRAEAAVVLLAFIGLFAAFLGTAQAIVRSAHWQETWGHLVAVPAFVVGYGWSLVAGAAVLLLAVGLIARRGPSATALALALAGFAALHWRLGLQTGVGYPEYTVRPAHRVNLEAQSATVGAILERRTEPARVVGFHNDLIPGWSAMYGIEGISGPDALMNPYYRALVDAMGVPRVWDWRYILETSDVARLRPALDALNVRFYVGYHQGSEPDPAAARPLFSADMDAYESPTAWPRAYFTDAAAVYADLPQYVSWLNAGDGRPFAAVERADWPALRPVPRVGGDLAKRRVVPATQYSLTENTTRFHVDAPGPGFIVLTEAYEKDNFRAYVNGERVPYLRVNHAFKAVYVDQPGTYEVSFTYFPRGLWPSIKVSLASLAIVGAALAWALAGLRRKAAQAQGG